MSEQLERETEEVRAQLAGTLDELRSRISPGQVMDQLVDYARDGSGGDFFRNLKHQVASNPLPVTLIGAGLAWLMASSNRLSKRTTDNKGLSTSQNVAGGRQGAAETFNAVRDKSVRATRSATDQLGEAVTAGSEMADEQARRIGAGVRDTAEQVASGFADAASSAYDSTAATYDDASQRVGRAASAVRESVSTAGEQAATKSRDFLDFCRDQPVVLAAIGVAVGAAIGAALPTTNIENDFMGETSDEMKERAQALAAEQADKAKSVAKRTYEAAKQEAAKEGLATGAPPRESEVEAAREASLVPTGDEHTDERLTDETPGANDRLEVKEPAKKG
jgi:ElaB/YqjD/DUF883 family membrane-anchored ribosome-binding protein